MVTPDYNEIRALQSRYRPQGEQLKDTVRSTAYFDSANIDPFGRLRVSEPLSLFDSKQLFDKQELFWDESLTGSGSSIFNTNKSSTTLSISGSGSVVRQTRRYFTYQSGKGLLALATFTLGEETPGVLKRIGYFDESNGIFLEQDSTGTYICIRTNTSGTPAYQWRIARENWNVDKFDGYGKSAVKLDFSKSLIFFCDFEWLGVGRVRTGFVIDGNVIVAHEFNHANILSGVYMSSPNLPIRAEISGTGTGSLEQICAAVMSEGTVNVSTFERSVDTGITPLAGVSAGSTMYPLIALRLKSDRKGASFRIARVEAMTVGASTLRWAILLNPTVTGSLTFSDVVNSNVQTSVNVSPLVTVTGGTQLESGYSAAGKGVSLDRLVESFILPGFDIDGSSDTIVLAVQVVVGNNESVFGSLKWFDLA